MNGTIELPKYVCHKKVWALKIKDIKAPTSDSIHATYLIVPSDEGYGPIEVDREYISKHKPEVGGYYVVYQDGYRSYSPADVFEEGYTRIIL